jgi:hypothetical protein
MHWLIMRWSFRAVAHSAVINGFSMGNLRNSLLISSEAVHMADWDAYYSRYQGLDWGDFHRLSVFEYRELDDDEKHSLAMQYGLVADFTLHCPPTSEEDVAWFRAALKDNKRKFFAAFVLQQSRKVPESLYTPMMRAAVEERNPSANQVFVKPCLFTFGPRRVNETLLDWFECGSDLEKAGAVQAMYHALGLTRLTEADQNKPEAAVLTEMMRDIWMRRRCLFLKEFVNNPNTVVRQRIIPHLELKDISLYPEELRPLVPRAIEIAKSSPDNYVRHRFEIHMGSNDEQLFSPLPGFGQPDDGRGPTNTLLALFSPVAKFLKGAFRPRKSS